MGWDNSDTLAIVALIVSLVALLVAFAQFAQSISITAEGSKQCGKSSIGRWSVYTKKPWKDWEFLKDVEYQTPEIIVLDCSNIKIQMKMKSPETYSDEEAQGSNRNSIRKNFNITAVEYDEELVEHRKESSARGKDRDEPRELHVLGFTNNLGPEVEEGWDPIHEYWDKEEVAEPVETKELCQNEEKRRRRQRWNQKVAEKGKNYWHNVRKKLKHYETWVSWDNFLTELYQQQLEALYYTNDKGWNAHVGGLYDQQKRMCTDTQDGKVGPIEMSKITNVQTLVAITLRKEKWSSLSPEVVRPPARAKLGDVILLAQYLGMSWEECDPARQSYRAFGRRGEGLHMSFSVVLGLGILFQFDAATDLEKPSLIQMLRTENANKMFFGIIPGDEELGLSDIYAVNSNGEVDWRYILLERLQLPSQAFEKLQDVPNPGICVAKNDLLPLLAPFMPLNDCPFVRINNPIPVMTSLENSKRSVFADWSCCEKLHEKLSNQPEFGVVRRAFEKLKDIATGVYTRSTIEPFVTSEVLKPEGDLKETYATIAALRTIHEEATKYLKSVVSEQDKTTSSFYLDLVRSHVFMVTEHATLTKKQSQTTQKYTVIGTDITSVTELIKICEKWPNEVGKLSEEETGDTSMKTLLDGYSQYGMTPMKVQLSWWNMMLRAIAWRLSVEILMPETPRLVPSWLHKNESRVWIA